MLNTTKTLFIQRNRWVFASISVIISDFIYYWLIKKVVAGNDLTAMIVIAVAGGVGCALACLTSNWLSKDRTYVNVIMSDDKSEMEMLRDFLAAHHITNVATDSYTKDWQKTITITAYAETKAESRLIDNYIKKSETKFKRLVNV